MIAAGTADPIEAGRAAWQRLRQEGRRSWDDWMLVAKALAAGRSKAMLQAKANRPVGTTYVRIFGAWLREHDLADMDNQARYRALICLEHIVAIEAWRATLTQRERDRWNHPNSCWLHYRRSLKPASAAPSRFVKASMPSHKHGRPIHWPQDCVRRAHEAMLKSRSHDLLVLARCALEAAIRSETDLVELLNAAPPASPRPRTAQPEAQLCARHRARDYKNGDDRQRDKGDKFTHEGTS
jgi:hypothetical protein